jgi:hypothetical protein
VKRQQCIQVNTPLETNPLFAQQGIGQYPGAKGVDPISSSQVVELERALEARAVLADGLRARLLRCQGVLTAIRRGLYAELVVLKEKTYQRSQTQALLDLEISSLLHAVMAFLQACSSQAVPLVNGGGALRTQHQHRLLLGSGTGRGHL